jgi:hypothetical protein
MPCVKYVVLSSYSSIVTLHLSEIEGCRESSQSGNWMTLIFLPLSQRDFGKDAR